MLKVISGLLVAILTLWVVPQLTRQARDRTAERNLKASIAREMATAHTDLSSVAIFRAYDLVQRRAVGTIKFNKDDTIRKPPARLARLPKSFNNAFVQWRKRISLIEMRLALEFPDDTELADVYRRVLNAENSWYFISQTPRKPTNVETLRDAIRSLNDAIEAYGWEDGAIALNDEEAAILRNGQATKTGIDDFYDKYSEVRGRIADSLDAVIQHMDAEEAAGLSTTSCDLFRTVVTKPPGDCS